MGCAQNESYETASCVHGNALGSLCCQTQTCTCDLEHGWHGAFKSHLLGEILAANQDAIRRADLVFAWHDDPTAYATLYEIGYAAALGKEIWIAGPRVFPELALVYETARNQLCANDPAHLTPHSAFIDLLYQRLRNRYDGVTIDPALLSAIEARFWVAWEQANMAALQPGAQGDCLTLLPQFPALSGKYRVDFAYLSQDWPLLYPERGLRVAIELDGLEAHRTTDQIAYDRKRQRDLEADGWRVIRFGGKEVYHNADACVQEARRIIGTLLRG